MIAAMLALAVSLVPLGLLAWGDPKRLRAQRATRTPLSVPLRRALALLSLLPGVLLAVVTTSAAVVLVWFGALVALGWLLAEGLAPRARLRHRVRR